VSAAQSTLAAFSGTGWEYVDEPARGDEHWLCPDCRQPATGGFYVAEDNDVDYITGLGCTHCRVIVPFAADERDLPHDATEVTLRSGEEKLVRATRDGPDYIDVTGTQAGDRA
jgi:hypothetical protein